MNLRTTIPQSIALTITPREHPHMLMMNTWKPNGYPSNWVEQEATFIDFWMVQLVIIECDYNYNCYFIYIYIY